MKTYAIVGTGGRGYHSYAEPIVKNYKDCSRLVGLCDVNRTRAEYVAQHTDPNVPVFTDFDEMMRSVKPECVIVTTVDCFHHEYIIRAMEYGADVITEKPMTMDVEKTNAVLQAEKKYGKKLTVTFNCRFMPYVARLRELVRDGAVGKVLSVDMQWLLNRQHGADYFRRWHAKLENCGGLLVHKATHHFDIVNYVIDDTPETVFANGNLRFYGGDGRKHGVRCSDCAYKNGCELYVDYNKGETKELYFDAEKDDGYMRDRCPYSNDINIYDSMSVAVKYKSGTLLTYCLSAHCMYEGWKLNINGTEGRIEAREFSTGPDSASPNNYIDLYNKRGERITYEIPKAVGTHGGGDDRMRDMIFRGGIPDTLGQMAGSLGGMNSIMIGICANLSIKDHKNYTIADLIKK